MEASKKNIIVVVGATGNQGSSVAHTSMALPNWHVRCLTRDPASAASKALGARGAEIVQGDLGHPLSLTKAFENANAIFLNTNPWDKHTETKVTLEAAGKEIESANQVAFDYEVANGKNAVIAAAAVPSLERFIYSAFTSIKKATNGKYSNAFHWEAKSTIVDYINEQPDLAKKSSYIHVTAYNDLPVLNPTLDPASGKYCFVLPVKRETRFPTIEAKESVGPFVRALIEDEPPNTKLLAYDSYLTIGEIVAESSKASGKEAEFVPISLESMRDPGVPIEVVDAVGYAVEFGFEAGIEGIIEPSQLKKKVHTKSYEDWLRERNWEAVLAA